MTQMVEDGEREGCRLCENIDVENLTKGTMANPMESTVLVQELMDLIESVASLNEYRRTVRKECYNLVRRLKLLLPLLEEIREYGGPVPDVGFESLCSLKKAILAARKLLKTCNEGSKIQLAFESEAVMARFHSIHEKLSQALDDLPCDELGISEEVKEQVELMLKQLKRAKRRTDTQDMELAMDIMVVFSQKEDRNANNAIVERLAHKLELHTLEDLNAETVAVRKLVEEGGGKNTDNTQQMVEILLKFKQIAGVEKCNMPDDPVVPKAPENTRSLGIPHEFLCPISLELMTDPVIVASGQTYERESIQQWFDSNHQTCPKSGQTLAHFSLAPNHALKNLISQWCKENNLQLPKKEAPPSSETCSAELRAEICASVQQLSSSQLEAQRKASMNVRMLAKENPENRVLIASHGAIPPLVQLLSNPDSATQEHSVTALLNLSIDESNKKLIAAEGAIPAMIRVLQDGTAEARENSAAALFSLSMVDENKAMIGSADGIPALVDLLQNGTARGKKDAATALFNLCLNHGNKARAVRAGIVKRLLDLLEDRDSGMVDEALSVFLLLVSHPYGRNEVGKLSFVRKLVELIGDGTPKNKECALSVLLELAGSNSSHILAALQFGVYGHLVEIAGSGTDRARRKANSILQLIRRSEQI